MTAERSLELFVRSLAPEGTGDEQVAVVNQLERLQKSGKIADYSVTVWGTAVTHDSPLAETEAGEEVLGRVAAFEGWAADEGVSLDRFIQRDEVHSTIRDTTQTVIRLPAMMIAEYEDGELQHVTPHERDDVVTVQDRLESLEKS
jgi:hypothetical protein